jgi:hypothetical protein
VSQKKKQALTIPRGIQKLEAARQALKAVTLLGSKHWTTRLKGHDRTDVEGGRRLLRR